jgi:Na+-driven multidrug efflux pump
MELVSFWSKLALPNVFSTTIFVLPNFFNVVIAGHMDDPNVVSAVGIGQATVHILILAFLIGMNGALETLVS